MQLLVAAVGQRMPNWVNEAWNEYARRMPPGLALNLREISLAKRTRNSDTKRLTAIEGRALLDAMPARARIVALDVLGRAWSTEELAAQLERWMGEGRDVGFLIGGPDGIDADVM
jgi:23S rRNA (pseudouridine1915-N3)-methyltransferase